MVAANTQTDHTSPVETQDQGCGARFLREPQMLNSATIKHLNFVFGLV